MPANMPEAQQQGRSTKSEVLEHDSMQVQVATMATANPATCTAGINLWKRHVHPVIPSHMSGGPSLCRGTSQLCSMLMQ
jgi:hypothetical protein